VCEAAAIRRISIFTQTPPRQGAAPAQPLAAAPEGGPAARAAPAARFADLTIHLAQRQLKNQPISGHRQAPETELGSILSFLVSGPAFLSFVRKN